jgi:hypothetical protein
VIQVQRSAGTGRSYQPSLLQHTEARSTWGATETRSPFRTIQASRGEAAPGAHGRGQVDAARFRRGAAVCRTAPASSE